MISGQKRAADWNSDICAANMPSASAAVFSLTATCSFGAGRSPAMRVGGHQRQPHHGDHRRQHEVAGNRGRLPPRSVLRLAMNCPAPERPRRGLPRHTTRSAKQFVPMKIVWHAQFSRKRHSGRIRDSESQARFAQIRLGQVERLGDALAGQVDRLARPDQRRRQDHRVAGGAQHHAVGDGMVAHDDRRTCRPAGSARASPCP